MKTLLVRYKTTEAHAAANERLVHAVFDELRAQSPTGLRYTSFRLADGMTFLHLAAHSGDGDNPVTSLPAFQAFQRELKGRCTEPPEVTELTVVDAYLSKETP